MVAEYHGSVNELVKGPYLPASAEYSAMVFDPRLRGKPANGVVRRHATATNWDEEREGRWRPLYSAMLVAGLSIVCWTLIGAGLLVLSSLVPIGSLPVPYSVALVAGLTIVLWPLIGAAVHGLAVLYRLGSGQPRWPRSLSGSKKARTPSSVT